MGEVVDEGQAEAAQVLVHARQRREVGGQVLARVVVDEVEHAAADALDPRRVDAPSAAISSPPLASTCASTSFVAW